ncbi:alpha/beta hydrolase [Endozoicomonas arenosclerae]|uniref:alpha/beta hydrolase n=1 Tax=Endozoicomonas arenosclerae TaxID=1633495 RepID=UPI000784BADA|nr:alpha/beta hydrolase [Endozoicomonas arenosclerae]
MGNKIVLITNRGIRPNRTGATLFKNRMTKSDHRLRCAVIDEGGNKDKYSLSLVAQGEEQTCLSQAIDDSNDKPWIFFVHGNNQTLKKNLKKCFALRDLYDVNVVAFSWPSVHHGHFMGTLGLIPYQPNPVKYLTRQLTRKLKQYGKARKNAELSAKDLSDSLALFKNALGGTEVKARFVCHSLGHRVLMLSDQHRNLSESLEPFEHVLLHQADEDNEGHRDWVTAIGKGEKTVITTNENDTVLKISNLYNHKSLNNQRLGNVAKHDEHEPPTYKDFTGVKHVSLTGHTLFLTDSEDNPEVFNYFNSLIGE